MPQPADRYLSVDQRLKARSLAIKAWAATLAVIAAWNLLFSAAPLISSAALYDFFSYLCHQIPERSLYLGAAPMAVCTRCFGIYFGLLAGTIIFPVWKPLEDPEPVWRIWLFAALVPIGIDFSLTYFGIWENTHLSRFATGAVLGAACAMYIVPAVIEIVKNFSRRSRLQG